MNVRRAGVAAWLLVVLAACSASEGEPEVQWNGFAPFGTNADGSPAAELVSPESASIDEIISWTVQRVECIRAEGISVELDGDGRFGYRTSGPLTEQERQRYVVVQNRCEEAFPHPGATFYTSDEWSKLYKATLRQADCFEQQGVDVGEPPSEATWIESFGAAWSPEGFVPGSYSEAQQFNLFIVCPPPA